jgi:hypothetical protein
VLIGRDLIVASRVLEAANRAEAEMARLDSPAWLPPAASVDLVLVDWADRECDWPILLTEWRDSALPHRPRVILFGPHTDLTAHRAARESGLGPMWARSKLLSSLTQLLY